MAIFTLVAILTPSMPKYLLFLIEVFDAMHIQVIALDLMIRSQTDFTFLDQSSELHNSTQSISTTKSRLTAAVIGSRAQFIRQGSTTPLNASKTAVLSGMICMGTDPHDYKISFHAFTPYALNQNNDTYRLRA